MRKKATKDLTDFQQRVLASARSGLNGSRSCWSIAEHAFPGRWRKRAARGAMIGHIRRAGYALEDAGLVWVLNKKDQFDDWTISTRQATLSPEPH